VLEYSPSRAERLIATGRVLLAAVLLAIWVGPTGPIKDPLTAAALLTVYVVYAAILAGEIIRPLARAGARRAG
jgi:hypothetical protein